MNEKITTFAETNFRNKRTKFGIKIDDRRRHVYVVGKTGMGKTVMLENMAIQDIQNGNGVAVVDPHGEFAERMLDFIPKERINDVIYFNPADQDHPIAFNVIEQVALEHRHLVASGLMGVFKKIWPDVWSARMEYILHNSILALLEYPGSTLLGINRLLADKDYRNKVIEKITDPTIKSFWTNEFAKYPDRFREEAVTPIQNKVGQFISAPLIRNIIGQTATAFNIREIMDKGKILIVNLSKGKIGEDASHLLGALIVTKLQLAAMGRVDIPEEERKDFYLYVDEFQNFATEAFANVLSEARKYHLCLTLAHQYITQMEEMTDKGKSTKMRDAIFGNVGTIITFRIGAADAEFLEKEFLPEFNADDLVNLAKWNVYLKLMIDGVASRAFSASTLAPFPKPTKSHKEKIIRVSREQYGTQRKVIEEKIARWSEAAVSSAMAKDKPYEAVCSTCNKKTRVSFKPDGVRPVYCPICLEKARAERVQEKEAPTAREESQPFKKKRKEVDIKGLRSVLSESLKDVKKEE
jgi:CxxC-x17-CxxC domain-containing protein